MSELQKIEPKMQPPERDRFKVLRDKVATGMQTVIEVANALIEIKTRKLWREEFDSWEAFCEHDLGKTPRHVRRMIEDAKAVQSLPPAQQKQVTSGRAASALAKVPPPKRKQVVEHAAKSGAVTAKSVGAAAKKLAPPPPKKAERDCTGLAIPKECAPIWSRKSEAQAVLTAISKLRSSLKASQESGDLLFCEVNFSSLLASLDTAYNEAKRGVPHAICPTCQGKIPDQCATCRGRGVVSEFFWDNCVAQEIKDMRTKLTK